MENKKNKSVANLHPDKSYDKKYEDSAYSELRREDARRLIDQIKDLKVLKPEQSILDVGCGAGEFGEEIQNYFKVYVHGIDLNEVGLKQAQKRGLKTKKLNIEDEWPYKDQTFNAIFNIQMIEHLINPDHFLEESNRVLKKNGVLIITTPNLASWFNRILLLLGYQPFFTEVSTKDKTVGLSFTRKLTPHREPLGHLRVFTLKALKELVEMNGFKIVSIQGSTVSYFPKSMQPFDNFFSNFPGLATDLVIVAKKK